jgi:type II secretory pathway pseudopilin PulG
MSNFALVAIVVGALATVLTIAAVGAIVTQRVSRALHDATAVAERLTAASAVISEQQGVTRRELDRLHTSLEGLRNGRDRR